MRYGDRRRWALGTLLAVLATTSTAQAATAAPQASPEPAAIASAPEPFHFWAEAKIHGRHSTLVETPVFFPFPPNFIPVGQTAIFQRTVDEGGALEVSNVALVGEGEISSGVAAKVAVHVLDFYNRNPTSSDQRIFVREAWIRLGRAPETLSADPGSRAYVLVGIAPRFSRPLTRALESYGLWTTAVGRFENPQVQAGGAIGDHAYWRAQAGVGNPLFFRDPNALAGDNGTPQHVPGTVNPIYQSGFPILYDTKMSDLNIRGKLEWGVGAGFKNGGAPDAPGFQFDGLVWYFHRKMADQVRLPGTFYGGDIDLLKGVAFPLPFDSDEKSDLGVNLAARTGRFRVDGQLVRQDIAGLKRRGFEVEASALFTLPGLFLVGETPIGNWIRPVVRVSLIDNQFDAPREYPGRSVEWDGRKYDVGVRMGLLRGVDLTVEYARLDMILREGSEHPDELLVTLRFALRP